jgi:transcription initiation factor IIF auxiliary subunit
LINEEEWQGKNLGVIKLVFGNVLEPISNVNFKYNEHPVLCHQWMCFLSINNDSKLTKKYIESVTYSLPASYKKKQITVTEPPFLLSRTAHYEFIVKVEVKFRSWTEQQPI